MWHVSMCVQVISCILLIKNIHTSSHKYDFWQMLIINTGTFNSDTFFILCLELEGKSKFLKLFYPFEKKDVKLNALHFCHYQPMGIIIINLNPGLFSLENISSLSE